MATESERIDIDPSFKSRIDQLVSTALEAEAREHHALLETVRAAWGAVHQAQEELAALRQILDTRDQSVVDLLETRMAGLASEETVARLAEHLSQPESATLSDRVKSLEAAMLQLAELISDMPESFNRGLNATRAQIEQLIATAIADASSDQLMATQAAAEGAAVGIAESLADFRAHVDDELLEVRRIPERVGEAIDVLSGRAEAQLVRSAEQTESQLQRSTEAIDARLQTFSEQIGAHVGETSEQTQALAGTALSSIEEVRASVIAQQDEITAVVSGAVAPLAEELQRLSDRLRQSNRRITESNARMEGLSESLVAYLADRDERLERVRDDLIKEMLDDLAASLRKREKAKLVDSVRDAEERRRDKRDAARFRRLRNASGGPSAEAIEEVRRLLEAEQRQRPAELPDESEVIEEAEVHPEELEWAPELEAMMREEEPASREEEDHDYFLLEPDEEIEEEPAVIESPRRKSTKPAAKKQSARKPAANRAPGKSAAKSSAKRAAAKTTSPKTPAKPKTSSKRSPAKARARTTKSDKTTPSSRKSR